MKTNLLSSLFLALSLILFSSVDGFAITTSSCKSSLKSAKDKVRLSEKAYKDALKDVNKKEKYQQRMQTNLDKAILRKETNARLTQLTGLVSALRGNEGYLAGKCLLDIVLNNVATICVAMNINQECDKYQDIYCYNGNGTDCVKICANALASNRQQLMQAESAKKTLSASLERIVSQATKNVEKANKDLDAANTKLTSKESLLNSAQSNYDAVAATC